MAGYHHGLTHTFHFGDVSQTRSNSSCERISVRGQSLTVTPVFYAYWRFAAERQNIFFRRLATLASVGTPVIGLTLRYDRVDGFWFTLLHELSHIVLHYKLLKKIMKPLSMIWIFGAKMFASARPTNLRETCSSHRNF